MLIFRVLILAVIGALIGWLTNIIAIKLIFRPLKPIRIPILKMELQGLIPRRRSEIAKSIGKVVELELLSITDIINKIIENEDFSEVKFIISKRINEIIDGKLPSIIPSGIRNSIFKYITDVINTEGDRVLRDLAEKMVERAASKVSLSEIVEDKINDFELDKIEEIILTIARKELKHIEVLGGVLGFIIGVIQGIIVLMII